MPHATSQAPADPVRFSRPPELHATPPRFDLTDLEGREVTLAELIPMGPLVVVFFRGPSSTECLEQLRDYRRRTAALLEAGAMVVAVCAGDRAAARKLSEDENLPYRVLVDEDGSVFAAWGLRAANGDLRTATFVLDKAGMVRFRSIETSAGDSRIPSARVLEWLRGHGGGGEAQG